MRMLVVSVFAVVVSAEVLADGGVKMTKDELLSFLPGAKVTHFSKAGSRRFWVNGADGTFVASSDNKKYGNALGVSVYEASGTWMVNADGKYCIQINWKREDEKWCAYILKTADAYYLNAVDPERKIEFAK